MSQKLLTFFYSNYKKQAIKCNEQNQLLANLNYFHNYLIKERKVNLANKIMYEYKNNYFLKMKRNYPIIFFFLIFLSIIKINLQEKIKNHNSIITIKINQIGMQNIYFTGPECRNYRFDLPDEVIINGKSETVVSGQYDLKSEENTIQLKWNNWKENWGCLFRDCSNIIEIDFSQFDFSQGIYGNKMFSNCILITSLNINDFGKVKLKDGGSFFRDMKSLTSLNLSNFDTSEVTDIGGMFCGCISLTSLDLSHFQTNNIIDAVELIFSNCPKLDYINFKNAKFIPGNNFDFISTQKNMVLCNEDSRIIEKVQGHECYIIDCSDNWRQIQKKLYNNQCVEDCSLTNYLYNYNNICYPNCPSRTFNNNYKCEDCHHECKTCEKSPDTFSSNCKLCNDPNKFLNLGNCVTNCINGIDSDTNDISIKECKCDLIKCHKCSRESYDQNLCISCNNGYYQKYDEINNDNSFIDCYQSPKGYYLDSGFYKSCFESCEICDIGGNNIIHNCIQCKNNYIYELNISPYKNCYTQNEYENYLLNYTYFDNIIDYIIISYKPENENILEIIRPDNIIFYITNTKNELELLKNKSNNINNNSIIDLNKCESILKQEYHLSDNDSLIILKNEILVNKPSEKNITFGVYDPYNKTKLNLSVCDGTPIEIYIPIELSKEVKQLYYQIKRSGYDMFNINDPFYKDICTPYDSQNETDVLLVDRINYFYYNNDTQCQSNCIFSYYFIESKYMQCSCTTNNKINTNNLKKDKFISKKMHEIFYDVLKYSNYNILKCYETITNIEAIKSNIGCIIAFIFFCFFIICLLMYIFKGINPLKYNLKKVLIKLKGKNNMKIKNNFHFLLYPPLKNNSINKLKLKYDKTKKIKIIYSKKISKNIGRNFNNKFQICSNYSSMNNILNKREFNKLKLLKIKGNNKYNIKKFGNIKKINYSDYELNELKYKEACKLDKRSLFQIYLANLKREHLIIFTFCNCNDFNLLSVKMTRFIFLAIGDMALNTFFFSDDSMHKLFINYGKYNVMQQIPQIIYSIVISLLIELLLCYLSLTDKNFYSLKSNFIKGEKSKIIKTIRCIELRLIIFFIFVFIFYLVYWYIISVFCGVYRNTQIVFIKDFIISFSICLIYPFFLYFISASLRYYSLKDKKKALKCLYNFSYIIPLF